MSQLYDIKGYPLYPGDLVRTYHFTGRRNKIYYLYHVAVEDQHGLRMLPVGWLSASDKRDGGSYYPQQKDMDGLSGQILCGHGPGDIHSYEDRPRRKKTDSTDEKTP